MEVRSLRTLTLNSSLHFSPRPRPLCRCSLMADLKPKGKRSPLPPPTISCSSFVHSQTNGIARSAVEASHDKFLHVVLVSPQIPGNTGCIARTCAASNVGLHLVEPLGYKIDDTKLKRAGLDYWPYVVVKVHGSWAKFWDYFRQQEGEKRLMAFTKRGTNIHSDLCYRKGDWLVFGSETSGLPPEALLDCSREGIGGGTMRIPMVETYVRCLNLSVSVGIALYEAARQLNYEQLHFPAEAGSESQSLFMAEDIFG